VAQENHHLTTEQFSAHLDGQLSDLEQSQLEAHLKSCEQCQQELTDLRRTVALLHALPRPALPRSFVLPLDIQPSTTKQREDAVEQADRVPIALTAARAQRSERSVGELPRRRWPGYVRTTLRAVSAIAAVIGFVFFLSGVLTTLPHGGGGAAQSTSSASSAPANVPEVKSNTSPGAKVASNNNQGVTPQISPSSEATIISQTVTAGTEATATSAQGAATPTATRQPVQPYSAAPTTSQMPTILFFDLSSGPGRLGFGFLLLLLGVMGFVVFKRRRQQERAVK
jgi:hypothetical protein